MNNNHSEIFSYLETKIRENYIDLFASTNIENYKLELGRKFLQDEFKKEEIIDNLDLIKKIYIQINSQISSTENCFYLFKLISRCRHELIYYTFVYCYQLIELKNITLHHVDDQNKYFDADEHILSKRVGNWYENNSFENRREFKEENKLNFLNLTNWFYFIINENKINDYSIAKHWAQRRDNLYKEIYITNLENKKKSEINSFDKEMQLKTMNNIELNKKKFGNDFYEKNFYNFKTIEGIEKNKLRFNYSIDFFDLSIMEYINKIYYYRLLDNYCLISYDTDNDFMFNEELYSKEHKKLFKNQIREEFGFKKIGEQWVRETKLYNTIKDIMKKYDVKVYQHYSPDYLKGQHYDVYFQFGNNKIAIEHQGQQHFKPIDYFGGEDNFKKTIKNDRKKKSKSTRNKVSLLYFNYDESLDKTYIIDKINKQTSLEIK